MPTTLLPRRRSDLRLTPADPTRPDPGRVLCALSDCTAATAADRAAAATLRHSAPGLLDDVFHAGLYHRGMVAHLVSVLGFRDLVDLHAAHTCRADAHEHALWLLGDDDPARTVYAGAAPAAPDAWCGHTAAVVADDVRRPSLVAACNRALGLDRRRAYLLSGTELMGDDELIAVVRSIVDDSPPGSVLAVVALDATARHLGGVAGTWGRVVPGSSLRLRTPEEIALLLRRGGLRSTTRAERMLSAYDRHVAAFVGAV